MPNWRIVGPSSEDTECISARTDEDLNFVTTSSSSTNWNYSYRSTLDALRNLSDYVIDFNGNIVDSPIFSEKNKKKDDTEMRYTKNDYFEISKDKTEIVFKTLSDHPFSVKILNKKPEYGDILFFADIFENFELNFYIFSRNRSSSEYRVVCLNNRKVDTFSYSNNNIYVVEPEENLISFYKNIFSSRTFYEGGFYSMVYPKELKEKLSEKYPEMANLIEGIACDFCGKKNS